MRLAAPAARLSALADRLLLTAPVGTRRRLGPRPPRIAARRPGTIRTRAFSQRRRARQPDRPDGGPKGGFKGFDAGKRIHGRKRHIMTDTDGRLLAVQVHAADIQDRDGAKGVLTLSRRAFPFVERVFADGGYAGRLWGWQAWRRGAPSPAVTD